MVARLDLLVPASPSDVITVINTPDDGWDYHPKHLEHFIEI
jgi:hypothetical protein